MQKRHYMLCLSHFVCAEN